jgi:hypothetical protein
MAKLETKSIYPIYTVYERVSGRKPDTADSFFLADMNFRQKREALLPADHRISFQITTKQEVLCIQLEYEAYHSASAADGEVALWFDPDNSRRKWHNAFVYRIKADGSLTYEEYPYELKETDVPADVAFHLTRTADSVSASLQIPLRHLRTDSFSRRAIGFNVFRTFMKEKEEEYVTWSGIPGSRPQGGNGNGILLLAKGLDAAQIGAWKARIAEENNSYFTNWVKWKIPDEIRRFVTEKKRGFTVRLSGEDVKQARQKAESTDWGRDMKREMLKIADYWAAKSDDELFELVPVGNPRALSVGQFYGDPLTGGKRTAYQVCLERPYQFYNPHTRSWWYNGIMIKNPESGETIVFRDEGGGFPAPDGFPNPGVRYMYAASYRLFILSMLMGNPYCSVLEDRSVCPETTGQDNAGAINNLAYAYLLTGDKTYARKALILLGRIAELVPYMNGNHFSGYYDSVQIAEPTTTESHWLSNYFEAADLLFEVGFELEEELGEFFASKPDAENRGRTEPFTVRKAIQEMIPCIIYSAEIERRRTADWSLRWIYLEIIIASYMESGKLMHSTLHEGDYCLQAKVRNNFFRDGRYTYDSAFYVQMICEQVSMMANNNYRFSDPEFFPSGIDMFSDPQFGIRQVIKLYTRLNSGNLIAMFGDNATVNNFEPISQDRKKGKFAYTPVMEIIYARMTASRKDIGPVLAMYEREELEQYRKLSVRNTNLKNSFLLLSTAAEWEDYQQHRAAGKPIQPSFLLQDSETSILRAGTTPHNCKHVMLYGQPTAGHAHGDKLGLWIAAYGYHLFSGAGNYPFTWLSPKYKAWEIHAAACAIVQVDGRDQEASFSRLQCHYEGEYLQSAGMENTEAYPGTHDERWCWLIQAPNREDAYVVDLNFLWKGGTFDYTTIGLDIPIENVRFEGLQPTDWTPMEGTMAGPGVPLYSKPGYGWMKAIKKAPADALVSWTYQYEGAGLKIHPIHDDPAGAAQREIICALGEKGGQETGKSFWEPFVLWRDSSGNPETHRAVFAAILEPFEKSGFISRVLPMKLDVVRGSSPFRPTAIEVQYASGVRDLLVSVYGEGGLVRCEDSQGILIATDAKILLLRYDGGMLLHAEALRYTTVSAGSYRRQRASPAYTGTVSAVDLDRRIIEIDLDHVDSEFPAELEGLVGLIDSPEYEKPSSYCLHSPKLTGAKLIFQSEMTLIKLDADWMAPQKRRGLGGKSTVMYQGKEVYVDVKRGDRFTLLNSLQETLIH